MRTETATIAPSAVTAAPDPESVRKALERMLSYLIEHPRACDTLRGISEWWAMSSLAATGAAVHILLAREILKQVQINGQVLFARNPTLASGDLDNIRIGHSLTS